MAVETKKLRWLIAIRLVVITSVAVIHVLRGLSPERALASPEPFLYAITGVTYAAHDPRIQVVASLVGGGNFAGLIPGAATEEVLKVTRLYDPYFHVSLIAPRPLLLLNVTKDQLVPRIMADALHKAAPAYAKRMWLECDHFFNGVDREATAIGVIDWVIESLPR